MHMHMHMVHVGMPQPIRSHTCSMPFHTAGMLPHRLSGAVGVAEFGAGLDCLGFRAPLRLGESDGCNYGFVPYSGTIVLLPRGGCSFVRKAMHMQVA